MISVGIFAINPITQLKKAKDSTRRSDLQEIRNAVNTYSHDGGCFPESNQIPWGQEWQSASGEIFLKQVPTGPGTTSCADASCSEYKYITENVSCPQWFVLFARKEFVQNYSTAGDCFIDRNVEMCFPVNYTPGEFICLADGIPSCDELKDSEI